MGPAKPRLIGFGISDKDTFDTACCYTDGAIFGSAFINQLALCDGDEAIEGFMRGGEVNVDSNLKNERLVGLIHFFISLNTFFNAPAVPSYTVFVATGISG